MTALRILLLEDIDADALLLERELKRAGLSYVMRRVDTERDFVRELGDFDPQVVCADYMVPSFGGLAAFNIVRKLRPGMPFILVSGTLGEEVAIEAIKTGITDYVLKKNLQRVAPAIRRALVEFQEHNARLAAEKKMRESEQRFRAVFEHAEIGIALRSLDRRQPWLAVNDKFCEMTGYTREELLQLPALVITAANEQETANQYQARLTRGEIDNYSRETQLVCKNGGHLPAMLTAAVLHESNGPPHQVITTYQDITAQKRAEKALVESEARYRATVEQSPIGIMHCTIDGKIFQVNARLCEMLGCTRDELLNLESRRIVHPEDQGTERQGKMKQLLAGDIHSFVSDKRFVRKNGQEMWGRRTVSLVRNSEGEPQYVVRIVEDVTDAKTSAERYRELFEANPLPMIVGNEGSLKLLTVNQATVDKYGYTREEFASMTTPDLQSPETREAFLKDVNSRPAGWVETVCRTHLAKDGRKFDMEVTSRPFNFEGRSVRLMIANDITARLKAEAASREGEARFRAVFDHAGVGITLRLAADRRSPWTAVNDKFCEMTGYSHEELLRMCTADITPPEDTGAAVHDNQRVLQGEVTSYAREKRIKCKDGHLMWVFLSVAALPDDSGRPHRLIAAYQDITERKRAEAALQETQSFLQLVVDTSPSMIFVKDEKNQLVFVNQFTARYYGTTPELMLSKSTKEFHPVSSETTDFVGDEQEVIRKRTPIVREELNTAPDGTQHWFHTIKVPLERLDGSVEVLGVATDITARKQAEAELKHHAIVLETINEQLEQRVAERTAQLTVTNQELESFTFSVSHDLRAPLRRVSGFSDALLQDYSDKLDDIGREYLNRVHETATHMGELIEALLRLSRVTQTELHITTVNLSALANDVAEELRRSDPARSVKFRIVSDLYVMGDAGLLRSVLANLLQNAWKFTSKQPQAMIEFGTRREDGKISYFVRDNGAGFDMEYADRLFGAFQRLHAERDFPGTGVGLATVSRVIRRHGGNVWAESEIGKGATFHFTLDDKIASQTMPAREKDVVPAIHLEAAIGVSPVKDLLADGPQLPTVLLVDDNEDTLKLAARTVARDGYAVLIATSGEEGLNILRANKVRAVVSDYSMPGMHGMEFLKQVKALYPDTLRIVLSGEPDLDAVVEAVGKGEVHYYVEKRWNHEMLRACLREAFK